MTDGNNECTEQSVITTHPPVSVPATVTNVGVVNRHVTGKVIDGKVVMLYAVEKGPCHESFGVHVAAMAQFPAHVIQTAKRKAIALEHTGSGGGVTTGVSRMTDTAVTDTDTAEADSQRKVKKVMDRFGAVPMMTLAACDMKQTLETCLAAV